MKNSSRKTVMAVPLAALIALSASIVPSAGTVVAANETPRQVAEKFDYVLRKSHVTVVTKFKLSTCRYAKTGASVQCEEKPRVTLLENVLKFYGDDIRSAAIVLEPARDKGIGTLSYEYYDTSKDNATWIYLSALGKVKRIISSRDSEDSGSFFGSEFLIEDLDYRKMNDYTYKILREETFQVLEKNGPASRPVWVLEWTPTASRARKSKYGKIVTWVDRERHILLKEQYFNHNSQLFKERTIRNLELIDKHWMPRQVIMKNLLANRVSTLDRQSIAFDWQIPDEFLTQRTLTDQAFRERYLAEFRKAWK
ncbi:MAG: outer membrane lipoprotein-sorting protein [Lysobacter sp.]|nr:MAG: outer membrane lipoprotein-sorting protein [Lysobacter sp.]